MIHGIRLKPRAAVVDAAQSLAEFRKTIASQHAAGAPGVQTGALATDLLDCMVCEVWRSIVAELPAESADRVRSHVVLVAHSGYGRREMSPYSDLDIMLLHDSHAGPVVGDVARQLLQDLFDAGMDVGQSVRTLGDACRLAAADATILSAMIDCRPLAGNVALLDHFMAKLRTNANRLRRRTAEHLLEARAHERAKFGQTVSLLEPNVKRSPGGLRDIQLVRWLGWTMWGESSIDTLARAGKLLRPDADCLRDALEFLMRLRNDLHLAAGRSVDDLTRDEQLRIAHARGVDSHEGLLGVERFMRDYFHHTKEVAHVLENVRLSCQRPHSIRHWWGAILGHRVDGLFRVGPREIAALSGTKSRVAGSLSLTVRLVELSLLYDLPIDHATWEAVRGAGSRGSSQPVDADTNARFLSLFGHSGQLAEALRRLHSVRLLEKIIPQFGHARDLLQFNNYHKYTVDEHCILAVERAVNLAGDAGWLGTVWRQIKRKRTVLLALLIHDLGKGFMEDHSDVGAAIARDVASRLSLPADEAEILEFLVQKHLVMAQLAFRRDLGDSSLVLRFACDVGSPEVLHMLAILTAADVSAVGPGTWTRWKADLLGELYFQTLGYLDGESPSVHADRNSRSLEKLLAEWEPDDLVVRLAQQLPRAYLHTTEPARIVEELRQLSRLPASGVFVATRWQPNTATVAVTVGTRENVAPGVFHRLAGALASQRLEILAADIHTLEGRLVIDHFIVQDPDFTGAPPPERLVEIADTIRAALKADRAPLFARRWNPLVPQMNPATLPPVRVLFDNESSEYSTIIEVFAHDSIGLLYSIAKTLFEADLSVQAAKIGTYLDQVVDAFHVTDAEGHKIIDPQRLAAVRSRLEQVAAPLTAPLPPA